MSSPAAGKFQDHYKLLDIDQKADLATIQKAHAKLMACRPSAEHLEELNLALEVLSDSASRKMFDAVRGGGDDDRDISFTGMDFFNSLQGERDRRSTLLCVLYDVRRNNPRIPLITMRQLEQIVRMTEVEIQLALWYAKTLGWVVVDDKSKMQITAIGVDYLQSNTPSPSAVWPYLKMDGVEPTEIEAPRIFAAPLAQSAAPVAVLVPALVSEAEVAAKPEPVAAPSAADGSMVPIVAEKMAETVAEPVAEAVAEAVAEPVSGVKFRPMTMLRRTQVPVSHGS